MSRDWGGYSFILVFYQSYFCWTCYYTLVFLWLVYCVFYSILAPNSISCSVFWVILWHICFCLWTSKYLWTHFQSVPSWPSHQHTFISALGVTLGVLFGSDEKSLMPTVASTPKSIPTHSIPYETLLSSCSWANNQHIPQWRLWFKSPTSISFSCFYQVERRTMWHREMHS